MNQEYISKTLSVMEENSKQKFLLVYGHELTIMAREAYVFQSEEVENPKLLRGVNEIFHRLFQAIAEIERKSENQFFLEGISHWISCEERDPDLQKVSISAFNRAIQKCKT